MGAIVHPLNIRLSPDDLGYIVNHAEDKIIIVDEVLLPLFEKFKHTIKVSKVIIIPNGEKQIPEEYLNYEDLFESGDDSLFEPFEGDENSAAFMCYTSGTTGKPKGILYSHRSIMLHAMSFLLSCTGSGINERDVMLPVVPMFHASAWGFPYSCTFVGTTQVFPGPFLDAESLLQLFESEKVTLTAGVPTVMMSILKALENEPGKYKLFVEFSKHPEGCQFSLWQRHAQISDWIATDNTTKEKVTKFYIGDINYSDNKNSLSLRFKTKPGQTTFLLNRLLLVKVR